MLSPDLQRLSHIRDYCLEIEQTIKRYGDSFETFSADTDYQKSISFSIMQIGELSNGLSDDYRKQTADIIPWSAIRGMRNLFAHNYGSMSRDIIWKTAKEDIPRLLSFSEKALTIEKPKRDSVLARLEKAKEEVKQQELKDKDKINNKDISI